MDYMKNILSRASVLKNEDVDYDRLFELVDAFELSIDMDYLKSEDCVMDEALEKDIKLSSKAYKKFKKKYYEDFEKIVYHALATRIQTEEVVNILRDELYGYVSVGICWIIRDMPEEKKAAVLHELFSLTYEYGEETLIYVVLKYMYDNFKYKIQD